MQFRPLKVIEIYTNLFSPIFFNKQPSLNLWTHLHLFFYGVTHENHKS